MGKTELIGFIGLGIIGRGMALNLLNANTKLCVLAHQSRKTIDELVELGANEAPSLDALAEACSTIILCLPNSKTVRSIVSGLIQTMSYNGLVIDCTTNDVDTPQIIYSKMRKAGLRYVEAPLTGGQKQALDASLGAIVGCDEHDYGEVTAVLSVCCQRMERFGEVGNGAKAKLISNFLALGTATLVVEAMKTAKLTGIDWRKFYALASQGSGHSMSLDRIAPRAIEGVFDGYVFSIANTAKDFEYICDFLPANTDAALLAKHISSIYQKAVDSGLGDNLLSERLDPKNYE